MEYDEIKITTRREVDVCRGAIRKLERKLKDFEDKYGAPLTDAAAGKDVDIPVDVHDLESWRDGFLALERWRERLEGHLRILAM
jgi:hypothetical protein